MRIIFKKSIGDQILEANLEAQLVDKEIERIVLTKREHKKFREEMGLMDYCIEKGSGRCIGAFDGVTLYVEED